MEFEESYFKGEEREGFFVEEKMKRAWAAQIEIIKEIERICKKHGLNYFAGYGTLLGAVRHKGFIPWDDDTDLFMLRDDYERFCEIVQQEAPKGYELFNLYTTPDYREVFVRLVNSRTVSFAQERLRRFHGCPYVVGVDIFPLDFLPREEEAAKLQQSLYQYVQQVHVRVKKNEEIQQEWLAQIEDLCKIKIDRQKPLAQQLLVIMDRLSSLYCRDESDEVAFMYSYTDGVIRKMKKEWFEKVVWLPFENTQIAAPQGYDGCLRALYGDNYRIPIRMARHEYPFYAKQDRILIQAAQNRQGAQSGTRD